MAVAKPAKPRHETSQVGNVASISQAGGFHNMAVQNQGLLVGDPGSMSISGGLVVRHP